MLTNRRLPDIMTNAWSLLYDELGMTEHSKHYYEHDRNDPNRKMPESVNADGYSFSIIPADTKDWEDFWDTLNQQNNDIDLTMDTNNCKWKYSEEAIVDELLEYIRSTYKQHYSAGDEEIQTLDLIEACGDGEAFCRSNILKYASRYDKKGTARRDILKILHYAVLLMYFNDKNAQTESYPQ